LQPTSGSVILPVLEQANTPDSVKTTLTIESSLGDILAVVMLGSMIGLGAGQSMLTGLAAGFCP
jgi:hypothetical protein